MALTSSQVFFKELQNLMLNSVKECYLMVLLCFFMVLVC